MALTGTSKLRKLTLALLSGLILTASLSAPASAYPAGGVYGRAEWHGYFSDTKDTFGTVVLQPRANAQAIPNVDGGYNVDTVAELITLLKEANDNGADSRDGRNDRTGSAFIVYTMLGLQGANHTKDVSDANWNELTKRLDDRQAAKKILWSGNVNSCVNSIYLDAKTGDGDSTDDVAFHDNCKNEAGIRVLNDDDSTAYEILRRCANPMGSSKEVPEAINWSVSVGTSVKIQEADGIVKPGNTIVWTHEVKNDGPDTTTKDVVYEAQNGEGMAGKPGLGSWTMVSGTGKEGTGLGNTTHLITQDDVGKKLCRSTKATPRASTSAEPIGTEDYCVTVPYAYSLTPSVSISSSAVEPGTELAISSSVANAGPTKSRVTRWQLSYITIPSGGSVPTMADSAADPCSYYSGGGMTCAVASFKYGADSVNDIVFPTPVFNYATRYVDADDLPVGTKVCYSLSVNQRSDNPGATVWRHSAPACVVVAKRPKVQVWGSDLSARGDIYSNTTTKSGRTYGSWGEYGLLASGGITGMSSASGLSGGSASSVQSAWSRLSFANVINATSNTSASNFFGQYATTSFRPLPAIQPRLAATIPASGATLPGVVGGVINDIGAVPSGSYSHSGNLTIRRSNIGVDKSVILKVTGKVTIVDDITYDGGDISSADYGQIPQLVLMADSIDIASNVNNVDSWLIAPSEYGGSGAGAINTCSTDNSGVYMAPTAPLSASLCDKILRINGPVVANNLFLRRTGGSGTGAQSGDPAEIINLRADAYLWAYARTNVAGKAQTIMTTELPPRF